MPAFTPARFDMLASPMPPNGPRMPEKVFFRRRGPTEVLLEERKDARSLTDELAPRARLCALTASTLCAFGGIDRHATTYQLGAVDATGVVADVPHGAGGGGDERLGVTLAVLVHGVVARRRRACGRCRWTPPVLEDSTVHACDPG